MTTGCGCKYETGIGIYVRVVYSSHNVCVYIRMYSHNKSIRLYTRMDSDTYIHIFANIWPPGHVCAFRHVYAYLRVKSA